MSDCMRGGRFSHRWSDQVWHTPSGREVHVNDCDEPHEVTAHLSDGNEWTKDYVGAPVSWFDADGRRYMPVQERDWDSEVSND